jgi:gliding motility-associated protein GldL
MFESAGVTPEVLGKLTTSFQKLNTTVGQLADVGDVVKSTNEFSNKTKEASAALDGIKGAANTATQALSGFNGVSEGAKLFHEQMQALNKNLSSLNTIYELELQEGNNQLKAMNQFYGRLTEAGKVMANTADDATKAKEQIASLANNLGKLNQLYGNMITAMQGR